MKEKLLQTMCAKSVTMEMYEVVEVKAAGETKKKDGTRQGFGRWRIWSPRYVTCQSVVSEPRKSKDAPRRAYRGRVTASPQHCPGLRIPPRFAIEFPVASILMQHVVQFVTRPSYPTPNVLCRPLESHSPTYDSQHLQPPVTTRPRLLFQYGGLHS